MPSHRSPGYPGGLLRRALTWLTSASRWLCFSVLLALAPIVAAWMFLPPSATAWDAVGHGELAVLAQALAGASLGALFEYGRSRRAFEFLCILNGAVLVGGLLVFAGIIGEAHHLNQRQAVVLSAWLLAIATAVGIASNARGELE